MKTPTTLDDVLEVGKTYFCVWADGTPSSNYYINTITKITPTEVTGVCDEAPDNTAPYHFSADPHRQVGSATIIELSQPFNQTNYPELFV